MLKDLCLLNGTSGDESAVRDYIISKIKDNCEYKVDALGSIIAFKKGKKRTFALIWTKSVLLLPILQMTDI